MIIPEDTPDSPKAQTRAEELVGQPSTAGAPPPAYPGYDSYQAGTASTQPLYAPLEPVAHTEAAGKRFFKAFVVAIVIWGLFAAVTGSIAEVGRHAHRISWTSRDAATAWPQPGDGKVLLCFKGPMGWDKQDDGYTTTIALPRTADELSVFARGLSTSGDVSIIQDERLHDTDKVHIDVVAKHMTYLYLDVFAVCILEKKTGHRGVGIFTPTQWSSRAARPRFEFDVTIRLPKVPDSHPLHIPSFETHLPNFSHHVGDLLGHVNFDRLSLYGSNSHIYARSVNATQGVFNTSNAHIRGQFESHGELTLKTSNADIEADVTMYNHNADVPSNVHLTSSNAYINSTVNLPSGYAFTVTTTTSNGRIALDVPSLAADARLMLTAETSNTPAEVRVTNAFEGTFDVRTSGAKAIVRHAPATDPTGRGRRRTHQESGSVSHVKGSVQWLGEHVEAIPSSNSEGSVVVRTRNAPATLYL